MPDPTLSAAIKEAYVNATPDVIYHTLEFDHPNIAPVRVVQGFEDISAGGAFYVATAFELTLPAVSDSGPPALRIAVDNVSRDLLAAIEQAADSSVPITVIYRAFLESDLSTPQNNPPTTLNLTTISVTPHRIVATCTLAPLHNRKWPSVIYTDDDFPGLVPL